MVVYFASLVHALRNKKKHGGALRARVYVSRGSLNSQVAAKKAFSETLTEPPDNDTGLNVCRSTDST